jgi:hypothetical protein
MTVDRDPFIRGHLDDLYRSGRRPDTREPRGKGLPDAQGRTMEVRTCLATAPRRDKTSTPDASRADS